MQRVVKDLRLERKADSDEHVLILWTNDNVRQLIVTPRLLERMVQEAANCLSRLASEKGWH